MKQSVAKAWTEALRSGKYKQGKNMLSDGESYCCLGVLCEVLEIPKRFCNDHIVAYDERTAVLPESAQEQSEMKTYTGKAALAPNIGKTQSNVLSDANDDGATFAEIADWIEKNWKEL